MSKNKVVFKEGTKKGYDSLTSKVDSTFYKTEEGLYIGNTRLNTTYTLSKENDKIILKDQDGNKSEVNDDNTTYSNATSSAAGLMSSTDKSKLDGIASRATANIGIITEVKMNGSSKGTSGAIDLGTVVTDVSNKANISESGYSLDVKGTSVSLKNKTGAVLSTITTQDTNNNTTYTFENGTNSFSVTPSDGVKQTVTVIPNVTKSDIGLSNVENKNSATIREELTKDNITAALGYTPPIKDTTYEIATQSTQGLMSSADKKKLDGVAAGATANVGTITSIKMNGSNKGTSGVVDLGTVITSHQDISGKFDKTGGTLTGNITMNNSNGVNIVKGIDNNGIATNTDVLFIGDVGTFSNDELKLTPAEISEESFSHNNGWTDVLNDCIFLNGLQVYDIERKENHYDYAKPLQKTISSNTKTAGTIKTIECGRVLNIVLEGVIFNTTSGIIASTGYIAIDEQVHAAHLDSWGGDTAFLYLDASGNLAIGNVQVGAQYWGNLTIII